MWSGWSRGIRASVKSTLCHVFIMLPAEGLLIKFNHVCLEFRSVQSPQLHSVLPVTADQGDVVKNVSLIVQLPEHVWNAVGVKKLMLKSAVEIKTVHPSK